MGRARDLCSVLLALLVLAAPCACGARTALVIGDGGTASRDLGTSMDMRPATDMHVPRDMPARLDMPVPVDMPIPIDIPIAHDAGERTTCTGSSGPTSSTLCTQRVRMGVVTLSSFTCFVDVRPMLDEQGTLTFDCEGGGALLVFDGGARFTGTSMGSNIDVCTGTDFDYSDGCHWQSAQYVSGYFLDGFLTLTYAERPTTGTACAPPCSATATVTIY